MIKATEPIFSEPELQHYKRQLNLPEIGLAGQSRLKQAKVLYIGAGGLGSSALAYLVASGVGTIGIIDDDCVEASNLHRQVLYAYHDIGQKKVDAAKLKLQKLNPAIQIIAMDAKFSATNALELIEQYDIIVDGSDNFTTRYLANDACAHLKKTYIYASISQFEGQCAVFTPHDGTCFRCLFSSPPPVHLVPNCAEAGVLGVLPGVIGAIQATEVIKLITAIGKPLINRLLTYNALEMRFQEYQILSDPNCKVCTHPELFETQVYPDELSIDEFKLLQTNNADFILLDVREPAEYEAFNLDGKLIPLNTLPNRLAELDHNKYIVVHCRSGGRSRQAMQFLKSQGFSKVSNLTGGVLAWIKDKELSHEKSNFTC